MKRIKLLPTVLVLVTCCVSMAISATAQAQQPRAKAAGAEKEKDWYYGSGSPVVEKKSIAQQKAEAKAQQRIARLESYRWLGYSPSRPPSTVIPFTSSNSLDWRKAERSPYVWRTGLRTRTYVNYPHLQILLTAGRQKTIFSPHGRLLVAWLYAWVCWQ